MRFYSHLSRSRHGSYYFGIVLPSAIAAALGQRAFLPSLDIRSPKLIKILGTNFCSG